jgi:DNA-binding response OmpR family regulator
MRGAVGEKRIVVAEDDAATRDLISIRLELAGYHAIGARDGYEALARIQELSPAALVLDIAMPRMSGIEVLKELAGRSPRLPVLVLTARRRVEDVREVIGLGADSYLTKPFDDKHLLDRVARLVSPCSKAGDPYFT